MKKWILIGVVGAFVATALIAGVLASAARDADASSKPEVAALLADMAPGAEVATQPDGSTSVAGALNGPARAEVDRAQRLADAHPWLIRCSTAGAVRKCTAVPEEQVGAAVEAGSGGLYHRVIYRLSTDPADAGAPLFDADEIVCAGRSSLTCRSVAAAPPTVSRAETLFVTYRPAELSVSESGSLVIHLSPVPAVPVQRTP